VRALETNYAVLVGGANGDGARRGLVTIVVSSSRLTLAHTFFQPPVYGMLIYTVIYMSDRLFSQAISNPRLPPPADLRRRHDKLFTLFAFYVNWSRYTEADTKDVELTQPRDWQGLTLVHFSAQPDTFFSLNTESTQRIPPKVFTTWRERVSAPGEWDPAAPKPPPERKSLHRSASKALGDAAAAGTSSLTNSLKSLAAAPRLLAAASTRHIQASHRIARTLTVGCCRLKAVETRVGSAIYQHVKLTCDEPLSSFALIFFLRRYMTARTKKAMMEAMGGGGGGGRAP